MKRLKRAGSEVRDGNNKKYEAGRHAAGAAGGGDNLKGDSVTDHERKPREYAASDALPEDLQAVIKELAHLKDTKWRGSVEYRLDGSGRIVSSSQKSYREISLTPSRATC